MVRLAHHTEYQRIVARIEGCERDLLRSIFKQGDKGRDMFIIKSGSVEIVREKGDREVKLTTFSADDFFGEMALFSDAPRSATARAVADTLVEVLAKDEFRDQIGSPLAWRMLSEMSDRIRRVDVAVEDLDVQDQSRKEHLSSIISARRYFV